MPDIAYLYAPTDQVYANQALEKHLLEIAAPDTVTLYLWQNYRTVVIGRNQNAWQECKVTELAAAGGHIARRISGGGAVYHDLGNLNFTFIAPQAHYNVARNLTVIAAALRGLGVPAAVGGRNDILVDGRKISGNAFYQGKNCFHHGTLLIAVDKADMGRYLQVAADKLASKGVASVRARVANLNEFIPDLNPARMAEALVSAFSAEYGQQPRLIQAQDLDQTRLAELTAEFADPDWLLNRPIPCDAELSGRFDWGGLTLRLSVDQGRVQAAEIFTDSLDPSLSPCLSAALCQAPFHAPSLAQAIRACPDLAPGVAEDICGLLLKQSF